MRGFRDALPFVTLPALELYAYNSFLKYILSFLSYSLKSYYSNSVTESRKPIVTVITLETLPICYTRK